MRLVWKCALNRATIPSYRGCILLTMEFGTLIRLRLSQHKSSQAAHKVKVLALDTCQWGANNSHSVTKCASTTALTAMNFSYIYCCFCLHSTTWSYQPQVQTAMTTTHPSTHTHTHTHPHTHPHTHTHTHTHTHMPSFIEQSINHLPYQHK